jgi:hypothetical protein
MSSGDQKDCFCATSTRLPYASNSHSDPNFPDWTVPVLAVIVGVTPRLDSLEAPLVVGNARARLAYTKKLSTPRQYSTRNHRNIGKIKFNRRFRGAIGSDLS